jgi:branched-chain amino acid transport system ATP-binding protein
MLRVEEVSVNFGCIRALDSVSVEVETRHITGLIGPNGAGKTTLFNVVTGLQKPSRGRAIIDGEDLTGIGPRDRARMGLGRTFQRLEVFGSLSARDNVLVALENRGVRGKTAHRAATELLERVGLEQIAGTRADVLPIGMARLLELARALACQPKVLLLDEPSSGLDSSESDHLGHLLHELVAEGIAVLLVEHDMDMVMRLCRTIYVMDFGRMIGCGSPAAIQADPAVRAAYLGAAVSTGSGA